MFQREFKAAYHDDDKFVDMMPLRLGSSHRTMSTDSVPDDIALPRPQKESNPTAARAGKSRGGGGGGLMSCCGSSTR